MRAVAAIRFGGMPSFLFPLLKPVLRWRLRQYSTQFKTIDDFQNSVEAYLQRAMDSTSDSLVFVGDDRMESTKQYLFISNHRDIVLDPALSNLALHRAGRKTHRIAIGDNLLSKPFASKLMRINKSFIVKRAVGSGRERLRELKNCLPISAILCLRTTNAFGSLRVRVGLRMVSIVQTQHLSKC